MQASRHMTVPQSALAQVQLKMQQCTNSKLRQNPLKFKPSWVSKKMPTATKLSIIDNVAAVETSAEKELFHQLYQEYTKGRTTNWTCILNKYNAAASESYAQGSCDIRWKTLPLLKQYERTCVNLSSIARSGRRVALLQGIAEASSALPGPSTAFMHEDVPGPAPPSHSNPRSDEDQADLAASILQRLPSGLTAEERQYLLSDRPQQPPWGDAPSNRPPVMSGGRGKGPRSCTGCSGYTQRWIPLTQLHKGPKHGPKPGCILFQRQVYLWRQYHIVRGENPLNWQQYLSMQ